MSRDESRRHHRVIPEEPMTDSSAPHDWERQLAYYKRQLDTLAGENLRKDYAISSARQEVKQKRAGFALLTQLQQSLGAGQETAALFETTMDSDQRDAWHGPYDHPLGPTATEHVYKPTAWTGFSEEGRYEEFVARMRATEIELPESFVSGHGHLLVNKATSPTPLIERIRETFELPYFVCVPVHADDQIIGIILTGRIKEVIPAAQPLNEGDAETLAAIAGLNLERRREHANRRARGDQPTQDRLLREHLARVPHADHVDARADQRPVVRTLWPAAGGQRRAASRRSTQPRAPARPGQPDPRYREARGGQDGAARGARPGYQQVAVPARTAVSLACGETRSRAAMHAHARRRD